LFNRKFLIKVTFTGPSKQNYVHLKQILNIHNFVFKNLNKQIVSWLSSIAYCILHTGL